MLPPPRGGQHSLSIISLSLKLVLEAGSSLRGAAAALAQFVQHGFASLDVPSFSTIRSWLLRVGYYALTRPLDKSVPWVWLADHTIQIGVQKILVILGCPMEQVPFGQRALQLADLQLVALVPMEKSTGALVEAELEQAVERTGRPRQIVADQGSDLKKGITDFQSWYPRTAYVPDVAHYGATQLEHAWDDEPRWHEFIKELQSTSAKLRQTKSAYLLAPRMRAKARFMNVAVQLRFARRVLKLLQREVPHPKAVEHYGWLKDYQEDLAVWEREHGLVETTIELVRVQGLHAGTLPLLEQAWSEIGSRDSTIRIAERLRGYVTTYQPKTKDERFVASTEVLESSFGKLKRLEGQQSQDGMTGLVLALGAMVGTRTDANLQEALEATPQKKVDNWLGQVLGQSMQWFRRQFFGQTKA
ncbi:MAG: hypothetical protein ACRD59_14320 [Candidatus Acidiferrales bacterium]